MTPRHAGVLPPRARLPFGVVGALAVLAVCLACRTGIPGYSTLGVAPSWQPHTDSALGFSVRMPGIPQQSREPRWAEDGALMTSTVGVVHTAVAGFGFVVLDDPNGFAGHPITDGGAILDWTASAGNTTNRENLRVRQAEEGVRSGFPTRDVIVEDTSSGTLLRSRHYLGRSRAYGFVVVFPAHQEAPLRADIDGYFESIAIDPAQAPSPRGDGQLDLGAWTTIFPPEAGFAIDMPGSPRYHDLHLEADGQRGTGHGYVTGQAGQTFAAHSVTFEGGAPIGALARVREAEVRLGGRVRSESPIHSQGYPGVELVFETEEQVTFRRLYFARSRL
jgi:hypothetical protein